MEHREPHKRQRRRCLILCVVAALLIIVVVAVVLGLTLRTKTQRFKDTFMTRCSEFSGSDCDKIWNAFEQAYVGRDPCDVPMEAYDQVITVAPFTPRCNKTMFWSKTKDLVQHLTQERDCFMALENTLLGFVLDGLTWCGKKGSKETFTTGCPGWTQCLNNPVHSFWRRASAAFAEAACGDVSVMLNGSLSSPFNRSSIFASIELKKFKSPKVMSLNVILVTDMNSVSDCTNESLKDLQSDMDQNIKYICKQVMKDQILKCASNLEKPCEACW